MYTQGFISGFALITPWAMKSVALAGLIYVLACFDALALREFSGGLRKLFFEALVKQRIWLRQAKFRVQFPKVETSAEVCTNYG